VFAFVGVFTNKNHFGKAINELLRSLDIQVVGQKTQQRQKAESGFFGL